VWVKQALSLLPAVWVLQAPSSPPEASAGSCVRVVPPLAEPVVRYARAVRPWVAAAHAASARVSVLDAAARQQGAVASDAGAVPQQGAVASDAGAVPQREVAVWGAAAARRPEAAVWDAVEQQ
jgi:hypothetical protein